ncbi:MAG: zinc dependent phospholipase C family protein [Oscillospiraceae bacterium]|nr:zinc dependent phospholipase C family protein [Oscillospiraceae bacterium]
MAYFMVHLNIAQEMFERQNIVDKGAFYLGSIAPDAISFKPGCKRADKKFSHFGIGGEDWGDYTTCDEWKNNLIVSLEWYSGKANKDFLYGYFSHVITDIETTRFFVGPVRDKRDDKLMEAYKEDCSAAEAVLLSNIKNLDELWTLLYQSNQYCLPEFFDCHDISSMIDFMKNTLYSDMPVKPDYKANIYSTQNFMEFVENTIKTIDTLYKSKEELII